MTNDTAEEWFVDILNERVWKSWVVVFQYLIKKNRRMFSLERFWAIAESLFDEGIIDSRKNPVTEEVEFKLLSQEEGSLKEAA